MKNKRNNRQLYQDTFDQIKLSDEGYRQIRNMEESTMIHFDKQTKKRLGFRAAISLAALTVVLLSANGIAYAATGNTLIEQVAGHVSVYVNGKLCDEEKIPKFKDEDWNMNYQVSLDEGSDYSSKITMSEEAKDYGISFENDVVTGTEDSDDNPASTSHESFKTSLKQSKDTVYLVIEGIDKKAVQVDITQDYADGSAEGSVQIKNAEYRYKVSGTVEEYTIDFEKR